eukprot:143770-Alexandrium_andersonii.AAC.1
MAVVLLRCLLPDPTLLVLCAPALRAMGEVVPAVARTTTPRPRNARIRDPVSLVFFVMGSESFARATMRAALLTVPMVAGAAIWIMTQRS